MNKFKGSVTALKNDMTQLRNSILIVIITILMAIATMSLAYLYDMLTGTLLIPDTIYTITENNIL